MGLYSVMNLWALRVGPLIQEVAQLIQEETNNVLLVIEII